MTPDPSEEAMRILAERVASGASPLEVELGDAIDRVLDVFERCAENPEIEPMSVILERLRARGVELPAWVEMMV